jgi:ankyrin repeat protein
MAMLSNAADAQDRGQQLLAAAEAGRVSDAEALIRAGAPVDVRDGQGRTPLLIAVDRDRFELADLLMRSGASINAQAANMDTPWLLAGALGRTGMLRLMIPLGPDLSIRNRFGGNALIPACERAHVETIRLLLTTKIDIDHVNNLGWTCLLEIVILGNGGSGHQEAARLVLGAGADPNLADRDRVTPLAHARARRQGEVAALIERAGGRMRR